MRTFHVLSYVVLACAMTTSPIARASHFLGAEIRYFPLGGLTYSVKVDLFTDPSSPADRPEIPMDFGNGVWDTIPRVLIQEFPSGSCGPIRRNVYEGVFTYPGPGIYQIRTRDQNRNEGIINIPTSGEQGSCVDAILVIDQTLGPNTSIQFDTWQTVTTWNWSTLIHDPAAFDQEGDSMSFELVSPRNYECEVVPGYSQPSATSSFWLDPATGVLLWESPTLIGAWVVAIRATEWRNGVMIGQVTRDMSICVQDLATSVGTPVSAPSLFVNHTSVDALVWVGNESGAALSVDMIDSQGRLVDRQIIPPGLHAWPVGRCASGLLVLRAYANGALHTVRFVHR